MTHKQDDAKASDNEFSRWEIRGTGAGHRPYWAIRNDRPTTAQIKAGARLYVDGDTPAALAERLRAEEQLLAEVTP
ncbi:hypothetical protein [Streptosporangium sp. NPDC049078]|uniref:hypothetical protein n=1 Tax=Streptosporangium sp. NPDC049078 TaxID=3155767 RepID=UPI0034171583